MFDKKQIKGFTLIELLVVIAVIALLVSVIMPALSAAKERTRRLVCSANLKSVGYVVNVYANENNSKLPVSEYVHSAGYIRIGWLNNLPFNVANSIRREYTIETLYCPANSIKTKRGGQLEQEYVSLFEPSGLASGEWEKATGGNIVSDYFWLFSFGHGNLDAAGRSWRMDDKPERFYPEDSRYAGRRIFIQDLKGKSVSTTPLVVDVVGTSDVTLPPDEQDFTNIRNFRYRTNHVKGTKATGGNALYGDGSVTWTDFREMTKNYAFSDYDLYW